MAKSNSDKGLSLWNIVSIGIELLTEEHYRKLQDLGPFDTKTSSWLKHRRASGNRAEPSLGITATGRSLYITMEQNHTTPPGEFVVCFVFESSRAPHDRMIKQEALTYY